MGRSMLRAMVAVVLFATPAALAANRGEKLRPGSVLVFPSVEIKWRAVPNNVRVPYVVSMDTIIEVENDGPGPVSLHIVYVNGDSPTAEDDGWNRLECRYPLGGGATMELSAAIGNDICEPFANLDAGTPPGRPEREPKLQGARMLRGYILVWAESGMGHEIAWNHLSGQATLIHYDAAAAAQYDAYAFAACPSGANFCQDGDEPDDVPGRIMLDGLEYASAHKKLTFEFFTSGAMWVPHASTSVARDFEITLMPMSVDLRAGAQSPFTLLATYEVMNENGDRFVGPNRCSRGWSQIYATRLSGIELLDPVPFSLGVLGTNSARATVTSGATERCFGSRPYAIAGVAMELMTFSNSLTGKGQATNANTLRGVEPASALIRFDVPDAPSRADDTAGFGADGVD